MRMNWFMLSGFILLSTSTTSFFMPSNNTLYVFDHVIFNQEFQAQEYSFFKSPHGFRPLTEAGVFLVIYLFYQRRNRLIYLQAKPFLLAVFYQSNNFKEQTLSAKKLIENGGCDMLILRVLTICIFTASALSIFLYQGIEFTLAMLDLLKNK
ncbi:hypothetical protein [Halalkalibacter alkalisediminis]|uniref:Uncharacterized protein n=1 Tax=Halalkalibacter alkalisediminis TaxID=935616 RepID=A0ABV6NFZ2_9BACI|nr:hypothetical protein [Halalkalibacter alkalisediminis]